MMVIFGALDEFPSRIMIESPFILKASNHSRTLLPSGKLMIHLQLEEPGRGNSCGDDVIIPWDSVSVHPQEQAADPEAVRVKEIVRKLNYKSPGMYDNSVRLHLKPRSHKS